MVDVTQIFEFKEDKNLAYRNVSRSINDLITEMNEHGLEVSAIDTSGEVVRVSVKGTTSSCPDKFGEGAVGTFFMIIVMATSFVIMGTGELMRVISFRQFLWRNLPPLNKQI